jgi:hypothetical protein
MKKLFACSDSGKFDPKKLEVKKTGWGKDRSEHYNIIDLTTCLGANNAAFGAIAISIMILEFDSDPRSHPWMRNRSV